MRATAFPADAAIGSPRAIIRRDAADGKPELVEACWGFRPDGPDRRAVRFIRSEGRRFPVNRCLVPASEFHIASGSRRYRVRLDDGNWFYLAGIWRPASGDWPAAFAVLTVAASPEVARYQSRQGAVLRRNHHLQWLDLSLPEEQQLVTPPARSFVVERIEAGRAVQAALPF